MIDNELQHILERTEIIMEEASEHFERAAYQEAEKGARETIQLLTPHEYRDDIGDVKDPDSQLYHVVSRLAYAHNRLITILLEYGDYQMALAQTKATMILSERIAHKSRIAGLNTILGNIHAALDDSSGALEYHASALSQYEELGDKDGIASVTGNMALVLGSIGDRQRSLEYFMQSLALYEELGDTSGIANMTGNIGSAFYFLGEFDRAFEYYAQTLDLYHQLGRPDGEARSLCDIGCVYGERTFVGYNPEKAEEYILTALKKYKDLGAKKNVGDVHKWLSDFYREHERWKESDYHFRKFYEIEKEIQTEELRKQALRLESERKEAESEKKRVAERAAAEARISEQQNLLHRMLPAQVADRLLKGERVADYFEKVSILFADIVGFTPIAARMPARDVIAFLNYVFSEFDAVIKKHGCEKIKTIGDGYMAVAGAPLECSDHAERIARAAVELMSGLRLPDDIRKTLPRDTSFHIRIGLHCGSAFGGIVGDERFVYDIYSDAVNLASRMESSSEPGKIHCSEEFAHHLLNRDSGAGREPSFHFEERGEIEVKGKGKMRTYFLERA